VPISAIVAVSGTFRDYPIISEYPSFQNKN
jgi:hypothetical protein